MPETKEHKELDSQEKRFYDINDVEIFSAGKWNGDEYTIEDLDEMVSNFDELKGMVKPYIKLGHSNEQKLLQKDGYPSAGWITKIKRDGVKLLADIKNIPRKVHDLIKNKAYGRFSSEIFWNLKNGDKKHRRVLKAAALLGGDTPAVRTLDDFINLYELKDFEELKSYSTNESKITVEDVKNCTELDTEIDKEAINMPDIKDLEKKIESLEKQYSEKEKEYSEKDAKIKELSESLQVVKDEKAKNEHDAKIDSVNTYIQAQIKDGKITPAQGKFYSSLAMADSINANDEGVKSYSYKEGEKESVVEFSSNLDLVKKVIENDDEVDTEEKTKAGKNDSQYYTEENNDKELDEKEIKDYCEKNELDYDNPSDYKTAVINLHDGGKE
jgi:hypothetical protein